MKRVYFLVTALSLLTAFSASAQDYVLLPENFVVHKGEKLNMHLITVTQFAKKDEVQYESSKMAKFTIQAGSKKTDLLTVAKDSAAPVVSMPIENEGLNMVTMIRKSVTDDI